jgi:putative hydrolase of the HAD superfamily
VRYRAVVFDLWQTLAVFDADSARALYRRMAARVRVPEKRFVEAWDEQSVERSIRPLVDTIRAVCARLGLGEREVEELARMRHEWASSGIAFRPDAEATVSALRERGHMLGLITVCSEDSAVAWNASSLARRFDAAVFSCYEGIRKPDPRIYRTACERLGVDPGECLFVGDGANDELPGAEAVGMAAVQLHVPGEPQAAGAEAWPGAQVSSLGEVLALL